MISACENPANDAANPQKQRQKIVLNGLNPQKESARQNDKRPVKNHNKPVEASKITHNAFIVYVRPLDTDIHEKERVYNHKT